MSGTCFGYRPVSSLSFEYLRGGDGDPLEVREREDSGEDPEKALLLHEWTPIPGKRSWARLYGQDGRYRLWIEGGGSFWVDPAAPSVELPIGHETTIRREERLWGIPAMLCFLARGDLPLHAAAVDVDGRAILLAAPGYHGKTTLAAAFDAAGYRVLSEDVSCIRLSSPPSLVPGPAMLRVRADVAGQLELPRAREVAAGDDRIHFSLDRTNRGDCTPLPVRALVLLRRAENGVALERISGADSLRELWPLSFKLRSVEDRERTFQGVTALADATHIWNLSRPLRLSELSRVVERIASDA
jgi:hypothetical protein